MHWSEPRESAGLKMLEASIAPSAAPAPTMVWSSSIKRITSPDFSISSMTALMRSSNWPRYFVPATIRAMSSAMRRLLARSSGTSPLAISCASPSTIAVLPTPASPTRTGLFFVRRQSICTVRRISLALPTTGSSLPSRASSVRSRPKAFKALCFCGPPSKRSSPPCSSFWFISGASPMKFGSSSASIWLRQLVMSMPSSRRMVAATPSPSLRRPRSMCSVPM